VPAEFDRQGRSILQMLQCMNMLPDGHDHRKCKAKQAGTRRGWISVHCSTLQRHEIMAKALGFATRRGCTFAMISLLI
jgi:hypothetical protein